MKSGVWLRILGVTFVIGVVTYAITFLLPTLYSSNLVLYFPQSQASSPNNPLDALRGQRGGNDPTSMPLLRNAFYSPLVGAGEQTAVGILQSRTAMAEVVKKLDLARHWKKSEFRAVDELKNRVTFVTEKSGFVTVSADMESPKLASDVVEALFAHLERRSKELTLNISAKNRSEVESQLEDQRGRLTEAKNALQAQMLSAPAANIQEIQKIYFDAYGKLNEAVVKAQGAKRQLNLIEANARELLAQGSTYPGNVVALTANEKSMLEKLITELQIRRQALSDAKQSFTNDSPEFREAARAVQSVEQVAKDVTGKQKELASKGLLPAQAQARSALAMLEGEITAFRNTVDGYARMMRQTPAQFIRIETARANFTNALTRLAQLEVDLDMAKLAESRDPSRFEVVDAPVENPESVAPRRARIAGGIALLALLIQTWPLVIRRYAESERQAEAVGA
ncbi:MAG: hypothetical protein HONBIEJF_00810 [Fimbriimonadaceae bacterium]|nr:hypothetical protein [Fimbriimonadaceae bacterium]